MARIAINGLGRIGRGFLKLALTRRELEVVAVNGFGRSGESRVCKTASMESPYDDLFDG
jgi:glyceraldehyde-3-phosphate dehydrogenase/erythrose-4-phosphate dehydrogenase